VSQTNGLIVKHLIKHSHDTNCMTKSITIGCGRISSFAQKWIFNPAVKSHSTITSQLRRCVQIVFPLIVHYPVSIRSGVFAVQRNAEGSLINALIYVPNISPSFDLDVLLITTFCSFLVFMYFMHVVHVEEFKQIPTCNTNSRGSVQ
jgi:ABC-type microcin C transport system permease subunit YejB